MQVIVGVHNDESYFKLKKKKPIDNTERRMENVKKYADQVSTKEYIKYLTDTVWFYIFARYLLYLALILLLICVAVFT